MKSKVSLVRQPDLFSRVAFLTLLAAVVGGFLSYYFLGSFPSIPTDKVVRASASLAPEIQTATSMGTHLWNAGVTFVGAVVAAFLTGVSGIFYVIVVKAKAFAHSKFR